MTDIEKIFKGLDAHWIGNCCKDACPYCGLDNCGYHLFVDIKVALGAQQQRLMKLEEVKLGRPSDPVCLVEDAPTIDAIPVDWLTERINETANSPNDNDIELNHALFWTSVEWERWKKENGKADRS